MKGFEKYLQCSKRTDPDWTNHYINYTQLKFILKKYYRRRRAFGKMTRGTGMMDQKDMDLLFEKTDYNIKKPRMSLQIDVSGEEGESSGDYFRYEDPNNVTVAWEFAHQRLSFLERAEFSSLMKSEISNAAKFYNHTLLVNLQESLRGGDTKYIASEILEVMGFVAANVITFRQLLIRYEAYSRMFDTMPITEWHLQRMVRDGTVHQCDDSLFEMHKLEQFEQDVALKLPVIDEEDLTAQMDLFRKLLEDSNTALERSNVGHIVFRDRFITAFRQYFLFGLQSYGLMLEPKMLRMRGRHLKKEMRAVSKWTVSKSASSLTIEKRDKGKSGGFGSRMKDLEPENVLPLILNLVSCFLFMMNNYIIEPSSAYYANALGSSDALSGIMIGAAPWFALVSAVGYSFWTNTSFKQPIIFSGVLMVIGNFLYANAYTYGSMKMCLIGRAITGLGAPRIINRRYVADATPFSLRTAASAAFAMATALGSALGPGMAILLDQFDFEFYVPVIGKQTFNGMTGPGYFMAVCWFINTVLIVMTFEEPNRSGLDELRERENDALSTSGNIFHGDDVGSDNSDDEWEQSMFDNPDSGPANQLGNTLPLTGTKQKAKIDDVPKNSPSYCIRHMTKPVALCMSLIFMKRIALESIVGATSVITKNRFGWSIANVGTLHLVNGTVVIPVSAFAGWLSQYHEDRYLSIWFLSVTLVGLLLMVDFTDFFHNDNDTYNDDMFLSVGNTKYIMGSIIAFSGIEACESFVASLMSKVVPSSLAVGTFNSGLLATLVGTGGRAVGDALITAMGLISIRNLLNLLVIPGATLVVFSIFLIRHNYNLIGV
mmetsp:Transcript_6237/g.7663  ORF Transcript_6237/g.7663 Transcript_6237/m.7663 type:complete len:827 (+) Transcript_6237:119-2599(+)